MSSDSSTGAAGAPPVQAGSNASDNSLTHASSAAGAAENPHANRAGPTAETILEDLFGDAGDDADAGGSGQSASTSAAPGASVAVAAVEQRTEPISIADIFGDQSSEEDEEQSATTGPGRDSGSSALTQPTAPSYVRMSYGRDAAAATSGVRAVPLHVPPLPRMVVDRAQTVRFPKIIAAAAEAYDAEVYDEAAEKRALDAAEKGAAQDSVIRWRVKPAASAQNSSSSSAAAQQHGVVEASRLESNARIVEWSDGSLTLHVGSQVFSLHTQRGGAADAAQVFARVTATHGAAGAASSDGGAATANKGAGKRETVLVGRHLVASRAVVRALDASAAASAAVAESMLARSGGAAKKGRVEQVNLIANPETEKARRIREEEEAARQLEAQRRQGEAAARRSGDLLAAGYGYGDEGEGGAGGGEAELDEGEGFSASVAAIKARAAGRGRGRGRARGRAAAGTGRTAASDEEEEGAEGDEEGSDGGGVKRVSGGKRRGRGGAAAGKKRPVKRARRGAAADSDSESGSGSGSESESEGSASESGSSSDESSGSGSSSGSESEGSGSESGSDE